MSEENKDNVILLPKTVDYYQIQLTQMLETERYREAAELLQFLLQCETTDPRARGEWTMLLEWLKQSFASAMEPGGDEDTEEDDESEADILASHVKSKASQDREYAKKMLDMLLSDSELEKKLLALEQLAHLEHPQIDETLIRWLQTVDLHPIVQFKALQILKRRGVKSKLTMLKCGEQVTLSVKDTPLALEQFPLVAGEIMRLIRDVSEISHPALGYFAEQTWNELLAYIYGTSMYSQLTKPDADTARVWAAALHQVVLETMLGAADEAETRKQYGVENDANTFGWEQAYRCVKGFVGSVFGNP